MRHRSFFLHCKVSQASALLAHHSLSCRLVRVGVKAQRSIPAGAGRYLGCQSSVRQPSPMLSTGCSRARPGQGAHLRASRRLKEDGSGALLPTWADIAGIFGRRGAANPLIQGGAPDRIRTCDLCLRRAALYPAELRVLSTDQRRTIGQAGRRRQWLGAGLPPHPNPLLPREERGRSRCRLRSPSAPPGP